jgi:threonine dehydratase
LINSKDIQSIWERDKDTVKKTPLLESRYYSDLLDIRLFLKCENLQRTGSYKVRGNLNKMASLSESEKNNGVVSFSAGNHAQAVAWAASALDVQSTLVMPTSAPMAKIEASRKYGAELILLDDITQTYDRALEISEQEGKTFIHPFEDEALVAGHGTIGVEIMEQMSDADVIVAGVGGGAMLSGISIVAKAINPNIRIYGVEPVGAAAMSKSFETGEVYRLDRVETIADGLGAPMSGQLTLSILKENLDDLVKISDDQIASVMAPLLQRSKLLVEPAGAAATAAVVHGLIPVEKGENVVSVISGGNIDLDRFVELAGINVTSDELPNMPTG